MTAACSQAGRYPQTCDQLRELLTAYKHELWALNLTEISVCVYISVFIYVNIYINASYACVG